VSDVKNNYRIEGDKVYIALTRKGEEMETIIDLDDLSFVDSFPNKWHVNPSRTPGKNYVVGKTTENGKRVIQQLHRWIMEPPNHKVIDHINHNGLDNRRENLRIVTIGENNQNTDVTNPRGAVDLAGVNFYKRKNVYSAQISLNGKKKHLGYFKCKFEAHVVYLNARREFFGL
jgi:hypothetical protein